MNLKDVGEVIAERKLHLDEAPAREISILIGKPQPFDDGTGYYCPYSIAGIGGSKVKWVGGIDAVQALEETISTVLPAILAALLKENPGLRWETGGAGDFGLRNRITN